MQLQVRSTSPSLVSAAVSPLHAPCSAAPVPIRRPRSRARWLVTRLSGLRFAVCCDVFAPTVESGVVPVPGPSTLKSPAKGCAQLAQRKHAKRCMKRRKKIVGLPAADGNVVEAFRDTGEGDTGAVVFAIRTVLGRQLWG